MKPKFTIYVEDYNVPLSPWYILNENIFKKIYPALTKRELTFESILYYEKDYVIWGPVDSQFFKAGNYYAEKIKNDKSFMAQIKNGHYNSFLKIKLLAKFLLKINLNKKTNSELYKIYCDVYDVFSECWKWGMIIQFLDMGSSKFSDIVKNSLLSSLKKIGNPEIVFSKLITPTKETFLSKENISVLNLLKLIQDNKASKKIFQKSNKISDLPSKLRKKFKKLAKNFGWMQYYYTGPAADESFYFDLLKRKFKDNAAKFLEEKRKQKEEIKKFQNHNKKYFSKSHRHLIEALKECLFLKEIRKEVQIYYLNFAMHKWYSEVARRFYWSPLQARYIVKDEFKKLLVENKKIFDVGELNKRYECCVHILENGKIKFVSGEKAKEFKKLFINNDLEVKRVKELRGQVAFPGKVKGVIKIVNSINDMQRFNVGDILVSFSTNPSLVPAMNKASAIITNTGGVTCHAAIVSRELKIPCIIGTKIATKVLKDGDSVEVDADKGIVKILK